MKNSPTLYVSSAEMNHILDREIYCSGYRWGINEIRSQEECILLPLNPNVIEILNQICRQKINKRYCYLDVNIIRLRRCHKFTIKVSDDRRVMHIWPKYIKVLRPKKINKIPKIGSYDTPKELKNKIWNLLLQRGKEEIENYGFVRIQYVSL